MLDINGATKSGSGTIVRDAVPFSALVGNPIHLKNIRIKRAKPGLRPQHLKAIEAIAQMCRGRLKGAEVGSKSVTFKPGASITGGKYNWQIGTAGSATMLLSAVLPLALFADKPIQFKITGGLFQDFAPSVFHTQQVLLPLLRRMGAQADLTVIQPGYVPKGKGEIEVHVRPLKHTLKPIIMADQGKVTEIKGIALSSLLESRKVSDRMARACGTFLKARGYEPSIEIIYDTKEKPVFKRPAIQAGACLAIWARSDSPCVIGSDMAGAPGRIAEFIGKQTGKDLMQDVDSGATVDRFLADQLIPFAALAEGWSTYLIPTMTDHIETRLWLASEMLGARVQAIENIIRIKGVGYQRHI